MFLCLGSKKRQHFGTRLVRVTDKSDIGCLTKIVSDTYITLGGGRVMGVCVLFSVVLLYRKWSSAPIAKVYLELYYFFSVSRVARIRRGMREGGSRE